ASGLGGHLALGGIRDRLGRHLDVAAQPFPTGTHRLHEAVDRRHDLGHLVQEPFLRFHERTPPKSIRSITVHRRGGRVISVLPQKKFLSRTMPFNPLISIFEKSLVISCAIFSRRKKNAEMPPSADMHFDEKWKYFALLDARLDSETFGDGEIACN